MRSMSSSVFPYVPTLEKHILELREKQSFTHDIGESIYNHICLFTSTSYKLGKKSMSQK